jgi:hypothetical protein
MVVKMESMKVGLKVVKMVVLMDDRKVEKWEFVKVLKMAKERADLMVVISVDAKVA